jgi:vesicle coat complex subunit
MEALHDEANNVRGSAATALGNIGASEAVPALIEILSQDGDKANRGAAATALGNIGASAAVPALIEVLHDEAKDVRGSAATALGNIGRPEAVPALIEALHDEANGVRGSAATALGRIGTGEALTAVVDAIPNLIEGLRAEPETTRIQLAGLLLRAAFRSGNLIVIQEFLKEFVSQFEDGEEIFLPYRIALDFLHSDREPAILQRRPPEMREAVELLVSIFDEGQKSD